MRDLSSHSLYPSHCLDIDPVRINELRESWAGLAFRHSVCGIGLSVDPLDFRNESSFVGLSKAHNVDHETLLLSGAESYEAVV